MVSRKISGGKETGSEKAQYPDSNTMPEQWGGVFTGAGTFDPMNAFAMKALTGGINSLIMTGMYHAFDGEGFKNDYSQMNWQNMTMSAYDLGNFSGGKANALIKKRQGYDEKTQTYDPSKKNSSGWFEDILGTVLRWSDEGDKVVKGVFEAIGTGAVAGLKGLGVYTIDGMGDVLNKLFNEKDIALSKEEYEKRRTLQLEESKKLWESGKMQELIKASTDRDGFLGGKENGIQIVYGKDGRILKIVDNSVDGLEKNTFKFGKDGDLTDSFNEKFKIVDGNRIKELEIIYTQNMKLKVINLCNGDKALTDSIFFRYDDTTGKYSVIDLNQRVINFLENNVVGKPYYLGGGQMDKIIEYGGKKLDEPRSNKDDNGNWKGYDCVGGVMNAIAYAIGMQLGWIEGKLHTQNASSLARQEWLDRVDPEYLENGNLIFVDYQKDGSFDHVMMYNMWKDNNQEFNLTSTFGGDPDFNNKPQRGSTRNDLTVEKWEEWYGDADFDYRRINWGKLLRIYGTYGK